MTTRIARSGDLAAIVEIYNQAVEIQATADLDPVEAGDRREWFERHAPDRRPILVAERGKTIAGWASLSDYRAGRRAVEQTAEISYYVHSEHRRQGVGSVLVRACLDLCPQLGIESLFAILLEDNSGSIRLLERFRFERWGHLPRVARFGDRVVGHLYYGLNLR